MATGEPDTTVPAAPAAPAATPTATAAPAASKPKLQVNQTGNLATLVGTGLEPGARLQIAFVAPSGDTVSTAAIVGLDGDLTSYGRVLAPGKHKVTVTDAAGGQVATTTFDAGAD